MGRIILITGGARSGKSHFALQSGEKLSGSHCFIATCPAVDEEMAERIERHRKERSAQIWETIEEPLNIDEVLVEGTHEVYLVDCLTLWINNLLEQCAVKSIDCNESFLGTKAERILRAVEMIDATVIFVTNEVGMGIVPGNALARRYRDLVGLCNRLVAEAASEVVLVSCGLPIYLKK
ncbi:MAG: bifunctional adenosylcobinamide kinase/adenosylcobinamide-phosphate guanylyltransferase [Desulfofustis sp.]|nr:bifunctional adenosylcobinamide kinase/adenosylcobinamide-phosphate guanylyltransferase [Desulfofustis sp.]NNK13987.1 bifunctional adenosylcobinamide kinase/adenosylcobinamide-phosphate guanylyltransferase [Desulfofustis sp.]